MTRLSPVTVRPQGFTLVELLVYLASMTVVLLAIAYILANTYGLYLSTMAAVRADRAAGTLMQIIATELRTGAAIDQSDSVFDAPLGQLSIHAYDGTTATEKNFAVEDDRIVLTTAGVKTPMTPADVQVSKFRFTQLLTPVSYAVRYELDLSYVLDGKTMTRSYPGLVILRRSYE